MWAKFDDDYFENRKVRSVSALAQHLHTAAILHCAKGETDGFFAKYDLALVAARARIEAPDGPVKELVDARLLHDLGDRFEVHDFLDYNPSHAELEEKRASGATRLRNWRGNKRRNVGSNTTGNAVTNRSPDPGSLLVGDQDLLRDPDPACNTERNAECNSVTGFTQVELFGRLRREILELQSPPGSERPRDIGGKAQTFAEQITADEAKDIEVTMRLMLEHVKNGDEGWDHPLLAKDANFGLRSWETKFPALREEFHGTGPTVKPRTGRQQEAPFYWPKG